MHTAHARCGACSTDRQRAILSTCLAAVDYAYPWDQLIARFKFRQEPALAQPLAALMLSNPTVGNLLHECDWVAPIPVTTRRLAERGYNQAWELTKPCGSRPASRVPPAGPGHCSALATFPINTTFLRNSASAT
ncbi:MAG: hypothetical protein R3E56_12515 [Burkholderiaceae bacterium]